MSEAFFVGNIHNTAHHPPLINFFLEIDENDIYNNLNHLRHPGGIFNITSLYIIKSLSQFIDTYLKNENDFDEIFNSFRLVLYDFFKFYDSCFEVMACFCNGKTKLSNKDFIDRWIEKNDYSCSLEFKKELNTDLSNLKNLYNKLKHTSNRIGWVTLISENNNKVIGYYLEKRDSAGAAAPADAINYPISLNREVRLIYFFIYKISSVLKEVLDKHIKEWNKNISFHLSNRIVDGTEWFKLYSKIESLPMLFLPNEIDKEVYLPTVENEKFVFLKETIEKQDWEKKFIRPIKGQHVTGGDGYTKSFTFPHMGLMNITS